MTPEQLKDSKARVEALRGYLDVSKKLIEIEEEEEVTMQPDFWNDPKKAELHLKQIKTKKFWTDNFNAVEEKLGDLETLHEFWEMDEASTEEVDYTYTTLEKSISELEYKKMLSGEEDQLNATIEITPGAGGTESCDWAEMLMRMYMMWGEKNGLKIKQKVKKELSC